MKTLYPIQSQSQQIKFSVNYTVYDISILIGIIKSLTPSQRLILNDHLLMMNYSLPCFKSQWYMGTQYDRCRATANRASKILHTMGLVKKYFQYMDVCRYVVNPIFRDFRVRAALRKYLPALRFFLISMDIFAAQPRVQQPNVTLNKSVIYKEVSNSHTAVHSLRRKVEKNTAIRPKVNEKKRISMEATISPARKAIHEALRLTEAGQARLWCFNDHVLETVYTQFKQKPGGTFKQFFNACDTYCRTHNIPINWALFYRMKEQYNITPLTPMFLPASTYKPLKQERKGNLAVWKSPDKPGLRTAQEIMKSIEDINSEQNRSTLGMFMRPSEVEAYVINMVSGYLKEEYLPTSDQEVLEFFSFWKKRVEDNQTPPPTPSAAPLSQKSFKTVGDILNGIL